MLFVVLSASVLWFGDRRPDLLQRMQGSAPLNTTALVGHLWLVVLLIYIWFITYGQWWVWNHTTSYYDRLANSFLARHLYIDSKPDAALLAAPSPYTSGSPYIRMSPRGWYFPASRSWDSSLPSSGRSANQISTTPRWVRLNFSSWGEFFVRSLPLTGKNPFPGVISRSRVCSGSGQSALGRCTRSRSSQLPC